MNVRVLVDTGPLVAVLCANDACHDNCVGALKGIRTPLLTCWPVLTEACWLLRRQSGGVDSLLSMLQSGWLRLLSLDETDVPPVRETLNQYRNLNLQLADAALLRLAAREGIRTLFTLDRRDFSVVRIAGRKPLQLLPILAN